MKEKILEVRNLTTRFHMVNQEVTAVESLSFDLSAHEILAMIGESGSGKSVTNLSIMQLIDEPGKIDPESQILFKDGDKYIDLNKLSEKEMERIRGDRISMIFQEPSASFNPLFRLGHQVGESLRLHGQSTKEEAYQEALKLLEQVHIPNSRMRAQDYPFQMSGGMLQRMMIAQALACHPDILIADEPTTALDVTTQAQILGLLKEKQKETGMSVIFITHDLALVEDFCDRIMILYAGSLMEEGAAKDVISNPMHPYTQDLLRSIPKPGMFKAQDKLFAIPGKVPDPGEKITGCPYAKRCSRCTAECLASKPQIAEKDGRKVRCFHAYS
ncbi:MAG: ABC transporter ATP-binding protein [Spirochaetia bacterium]|nr:ABC transporter ATP-binding protein [Spirochaetia bacterium]